MKNFAEQQMGAVLNPYANHPEMNRTAANAAAEMPADVVKVANDLVGDYLDLSDRRNAQLAKLVAKAILAERQRAVEICTDHIKVLRHIYQNDTARAIEQVRAEIRGAA